MYTYTAMVESTVDEVTVTATKNETNATIEYLDESSDVTLDDADTGMTGHQVAVAVGDTVIKVKVTAQNTTTFLIYMVTVSRAAAMTPTGGICDRTQQVHEAIVGVLSGVDDCAAVTDADLAGITHLQMVGKSIASLKSGDFAGLTSLEELRLNENDLESLPGTVFSGLTSLTTLNLNENDLESLLGTVFSGLTSLTTLELSYISLDSLPDRLFSGLTSLTYLNLEGNDLESLPGTVFSGLTSLTNLRLSSNDLDSLPGTVFSGLTSLTNIALSSNALNALPDGLFSGLTALTDLSLDGNPTNPLPVTVTVEKVGTDQVRAKVLAGAPFAVGIPVTVVDGTLDGSVTALSVALGEVDSTAVTVTRTAGTTAAVTVDVDLSTPPTLPRGHTGYAFAKATTGLPATILPDAGASSDATLSGLVVNDGRRDLTLRPGFAPDEDTYTAMVVNTVAEVTVTPTPNDSGATIEYLDASSNVTLEDADTGVTGQQVAVGGGRHHHPGEGDGRGRRHHPDLHGDGDAPRRGRSGRRGRSALDGREIVHAPGWACGGLGTRRDIPRRALGHGVQRRLLAGHDLQGHRGPGYERRPIGHLSRMVNVDQQCPRPVLPGHGLRQPANTRRATAGRKCR